jgi:hypothetical protein
MGERMPHARIDLRASSKARDETYVRLHLIPRFGDVPLVRIERQDIQRWVNDLGTKGLAPATVRACHRLISGIFTEAVEARLIAQSPAEASASPGSREPSRDFLQPNKSSDLPTQSPTNTSPTSIQPPI